MSTLRDPFFGSVVPTWVRWACPTYYLGIAASAVYIVPMVLGMVICGLVISFGQGFIAIPKGFDHE